MSCAISLDVALVTAPNHGVASDTSPSPDVYWKAHTYVHESGTLSIAHEKFQEEQDKANIRSLILIEHPLTQP